LEYTYYKPQEEENVYEGNMAQYGENVASYATRMVWDDPDVLREGENKNMTVIPPKAGL